MDDATLAALCIATEAAGEPYEGKVAIGLVIRKRMAALFFSDGTIAGTILRKLQFSAFWSDYVGGKYQVVCNTAADAEARAQVLLARYQLQPGVMRQCAAAWADSAPDGTFSGGPQFQKLKAEPRALLYCNPVISSPDWATPDKLVAEIFHHSFFRG